MIRALLVAIATTLALMGCQHAREAQADDVGFHLNEAFVLAGAQDAVIAGEQLRMRFDEVPEDSRCPVRVQCVWSGLARVDLVIQVQDAAPKTVAFNTNPAPGQNVQTVRVDDYVIELLSLEPYPQTAEDAIRLQQYRATLVVRKSTP